LDGFEGHFRTEGEPWKAVLREGIIVLDTNALLDAYRMSPRARKEFLAVLRSLRDRLFVPHQVAHEFHEKRTSVIADREKEIKVFPGKVKNFLTEAQSLIDQHTARTQVDATILNELHVTIDNLKKEVQRLSETIQAEYDLDKRKATLGDDAVLVDLVEILTGRVSLRPSDAQLIADRREGERRIRYQIPPGFADEGKGPEAVGDYLWWAEVVRYVSTMQKSVLVVTGDTKRDWRLKRDGIEIGEHPQLVEEIRRAAAGVELAIRGVDDLLRAAPAELEADVSETTVTEAQTLHVLAHTSLEPAVLEECVALMRSAIEAGQTRATGVARELLRRHLAALPRSTEPLLVEGVDFSGLDLSGIDFHHFTLRNVQLSHANLAGTIFGMATIEGDLIGADLSNADLWRTTIVGNLAGASLKGARLSEAILLQAHGMTQEQIEEAYGDTGTRLPPGFHHPDHWPDNMRHPGGRQ